MFVDIDRPLRVLEFGEGMFVLVLSDVSFFNSLIGAVIFKVKDDYL